ncbi:MULTISPECIES: GH25 family lysozyme [Amylolactobacillus]|nr:MULTISPECIES: GH25 family lysozyme [Amylolactobacillus]GED80091.1 lysozyme [Amylolactobacillus amylophilus]
MQSRFKHRYTMQAIIITLILALAGIGFAVYRLATATTYPDNNSAKIIGVLLDQSRGYVDFNQIEQEDIDFVYLRSTQGKSYFDDRYLENRDRLVVTQLDFGTAQYFSNESSVEEQFNYFREKVGRNTGILPVLIIPAADYHGAKFWRKMAEFTRLLKDSGDDAVVLARRTEVARYFGSQPVEFIAPTKKKPGLAQNYLFWRYTSTGRIRNMAQMDDLTMLSFMGSQSDYSQLVGRN